MKIPQYLENNLWKAFDSDEDNIYKASTLSIFEDYAKTSLYYPYNIMDKHCHAHDFENVLKICFDYPETFILTNEDKSFYTTRQIEFLNKLQKQCQKDNLKDIMIDNKFIKEELIKRNYKNYMD